MTARLTTDPEIMRLRALLGRMVRLQYLDADQATIVVTDACTTTGHLPKIEKPYELKSDWQRGCVCGKQAFA